MLDEALGTLAGSADRFERLAQGDDLQQIQARLREEADVLRRVATERRAVWEETLREFGTRLTSLETQLDRTRREAAIDPLTDVANRRLFERTCREWLRPNRPSFIMAMADVDDFKAINDRYGHAIGDQVLVTVAETLARSLRGGDLVARLGGDEFAVLAACLSLPQAKDRFTTIGRAVQNACQAVISDGPAPSISIGITECSTGDTLESLRHRADAALYRAKRHGKNRVAMETGPVLHELPKNREGQS
jgi:diguanylate cyclase (GGDEF)-like protein